MSHSRRVSVNPQAQERIIPERADHAADADAAGNRWPPSSCAEPTPAVDRDAWWRELDHVVELLRG